MMKAMKLCLTGAAALTLAGVAGAAAPCGDACKSNCCLGAKDADAHAKVGESAPNFSLVDLNGDKHTLSDYTAEGKIVVLEWFNPMCPFVVKHHDHNTTMATTYAEFKDKDVVWLAVNSAKEGHPTGSHEANMKMAKEWNIAYPILVDQSGEVGKAFGAKTTPQMYVIDADGVLAYAGAIDDNKSAKKAGETNYVHNALVALVNGETVEVSETKSYGCSVKY